MDEQELATTTWHMQYTHTGTPWMQIIA